MVPKRLRVKTICVIIALLSLFTFAAINPFTKNPDKSGWNQYGGGPDQSKYFEASQINKENVNQLKVAWVYPSVDSSFNFFSPIVVDTIMYVMAKNSSLVAVNAETGKEIWIHANLQDSPAGGLITGKARTEKTNVYCLQ